MDFVETRPLAEHPGGAVGLAGELGGLVARVQATPAFPILGDGGDLIAGLLDGLMASAMFAPGVLDRLGSGQAATAQAFGKMSLRAFVDGVSTPGFAQTLALAAQA